MASPRIFVSSTCYDLKEVRNQLRRYIEDYGLEPVMSEYGDIFYNYDRHIQESCKDEIEKCQLFILIIGNNYGSIYYEQDGSVEVPDSVTLQEFRKAIDTNIYKHIFINKYVEHDYKNYKKLKLKHLQGNLRKTEVVSKEEVNLEFARIEGEFRENYLYPEPSYKYIFNFLDIVYDLKTGNSVLPFENFEEIKYSLKKQWSALMYESLIRRNTVSLHMVSSINDKLERIEKQIKGLLDSKIGDGDTGKLSIDLNSLASTMKITNFEDLKSRLYEGVYELLYDDGDPRCIFHAKFDSKKVDKLLSRLKGALESNKWAKSVDLKDVFIGLVPLVYWQNRMEISYSSLLSFFSVLEALKAGVSEEDFQSLKKTLLDELNKRFEEKQPEPEDDDLPF